MDKSEDINIIRLYIIILSFFYLINNSKVFYDYLNKKKSQIFIINLKSLKIKE